MDHPLARAVRPRSALVRRPARGSHDGIAIAGEPADAFMAWLIEPDASGGGDVAAPETGLPHSMNQAASRREALVNSAPDASPSAAARDATRRARTRRTADRRTDPRPWPDVRSCPCSRDTRSR